MKKRLFAILGLLVLAAIAIFFGLWINNKRQSRHLYGEFDIGMKCACGHEIFLDLEAGDAYDDCPGHRYHQQIGRVVRTKDSVTVIDPRDDAPWFRVDWDGSSHSLSFLKRPDSSSLMGMIPVRGAIDQVTNPWRLSLPGFLPEE